MSIDRSVFLSLPFVVVFYLREMWHIIALVVLAVASIASFLFFRQRQAKPDPPPEPDDPPPAANPPLTAKSAPQKPSKKIPQRQTPQPLSTAEKVIALPSTTPESFCFDPSGEYIFVHCQNRNQLVYYGDL
jgi:hypothetical protein